MVGDTPGTMDWCLCQRDQSEYRTLPNEGEWLLDDFTLSDMCVSEAQNVNTGESVRD